MKKNKIIALLALFMFFCGCLGGGPPKSSSTTITLEANSEPYLKINSQKIIMNQFSVDEAYLNKPGFIVLIAGYGGNDSVVVGVSPIFEDAARNINIAVLNYSGQSPIHAVACYDNGDGVFNYSADVQTDVVVVFNVTEGTTSTTTISTTSSTTLYEPKLEHIVINDFEFKPDNLVIHKGDSVKWINQDSAEHRIIASNVFDSGTIREDENFVYTFTMEGVYHYKCDFYPVMTGLIIVEG